MDKILSAKDLLKSNEAASQEESLSYVPLDTAAAVNEHGEYVQSGETCRIDALKDHFAWMRGFVNAWYGWPNDGKMEYIENRIMTSKGFKKMGELKVGDSIFDEAGNPCNVTFITDLKLDKKCFKVTFNDGESVICGEEHLWLTYTNEELRSYNTHRKRVITRTNFDQSFKRKQPQVRSTLEISKTMVGRKGGTSSNHAIPVCKPLNFPFKKLRIDPYSLGAWLGDGYSAGARIINHIIDIDIIRNFEKAGYLMRQRTKRENTFDYKIGTKGEFQKLLRSYNLINNKHIPVDYLTSSYEQRLSIVQGLMDTDGYVNKAGMCEFCCCGRPELADQVYSLICSLGIRASINISDAKLYGRKTSTRYRIFFKTTLPVFRLKRKLARLPKRCDASQEFRFIVKCEPIDSVPCKCIQVDSPNKLYLTGRAFIPTHNTTFLDYIMLMKSRRDNWKWCIYKMEDMDTIISDGKPQIRANRIYKNLAWSLTGKTWNRSFAERNRTSAMTLAEEQEALNFISEHFFVIYPKDRKLNSILDQFKFMHEKYGIDGFMLDPWNVVKLDDNKRGDHQLVDAFIDIKEFAMLTNTVFNIVSHPRSMVDVKEKDGNRKGHYKVVNQFMQLGGSAWDIKMDGQYSIYRPYRHDNPRDPRVEFYNLKQRQNEIIGVDKGEVDGIEFDRIKKQYIFNGINPMNGTMKQSNFNQQGSVFNPATDDAPF